MGFQLEAKAAINAKPANAGCCELLANWKVFRRLTTSKPAKCWFGPYCAISSAPQVAREQAGHPTTAPGQRHPPSCPRCSRHLPRLAGALATPKPCSTEEQGPRRTQEL